MVPKRKNSAIEKKKKKTRTTKNQGDRKQKTDTIAKPKKYASGLPVNWRKDSNVEFRKTIKKMIANVIRIGSDPVKTQQPMPPNKPALLWGEN